MPIVIEVSSQNVPLTYLSRRVVFPTPPSPATKILNTCSNKFFDICYPSTLVSLFLLKSICSLCYFSLSITLGTGGNRQNLPVDLIFITLLALLLFNDHHRY